MRLRRGFPMIAPRGGRSVDVAVASYVAAAATNGGAVSAGRQTLLRTLISASMDLDHWWNTDDIALMAAEDEGSSLTLLKSGVKMTAVNAPVFTADRQWACDGLSSYLNTNYSASGVTRRMQLGNVRLGVYERTNVGSAGTSLAAANTGGQAILLRARNATSQMVAQTNSSSALFGSVTDSSGLKTVSRANGVLSISGWERGVALTPVAVTSNNDSIPSVNIYIGARNNNGSADQLRAGSFACAEWGGALPGGTASELAWYNALQTFMTAIGANV